MTEIANFEVENSTPLLQKSFRSDMGHEHHRPSPLEGRTSVRYSLRSLAPFTGTAPIFAAKTAKIGLCPSIGMPVIGSQSLRSIDLEAAPSLRLEGGQNQFDGPSAVF